MTKDERIARLEERVAHLEMRLAEAEQKPSGGYRHPYWYWGWSPYDRPWWNRYEITCGTTSETTPSIFSASTK